MLKVSCLFWFVDSGREVQFCERGMPLKPVVAPRAQVAMTAPETMNIPESSQTGPAPLVTFEELQKDPLSPEHVFIAVKEHSTRGCLRPREVLSLFPPCLERDILWLVAACKRDRVFCMVSRAQTWQNVCDPECCSHPY